MMVGLALIRVGDVSPVALQLRASTASGPTARLVWENAEPEGTLSQDGRLLSITHWDSGGNVGVHDMVTGLDRPLTNEITSQDYTEQSAISRDGSRVAYTFWDHETRQYELRVARTDQDPSEPSVRLYVDKNVEWLAPWDWSPDGHWIAAEILGKDRSNKLGLVNSTDGRVRVLKSSVWRGSKHISFSPDGRWVAYDAPSSITNAARDVFVAAVDGTQDRAVVRNPGNDVVVDWSPDGKSLLFSGDQAGAPGLWSVPLADGKAQGPAELVSPGFEGPGFITDSGQLYHIVHINHWDVYVADFDFDTGEVISEPVNVVPRFVGRNMLPEWSPDGTRLAFLSPRPYVGGRILVILSPETGEMKEFPNVQAGALHWTPDGNSLMISGNVEGRRGYLQFDLESGTAEEVVLGELDEIRGGGALSPDGLELYYLRWHPEEPTMSLHLRQLASGAERELLRNPGLSAVNPSPDGKWLALRIADANGGQPGLYVMPIRSDGSYGESQQLMPEIARASGLSWAPDSQSLLLWGGDDDSWQAFVDGREPRLLQTSLGPGPVSVHPNGRKIAYWSGHMKPTFELWVLENFLPAGGTMNHTP